MRAVTSATAAAVLGLERKALDSLLARIGKDEGLLRPGRQGVERRIPIHLLELLALTADLVASLGQSPREAFALAQSLAPTDLERHAGVMDSTGATRVADVGQFARLSVDREALRREIEERLAVAIESMVRPRRGRPPKR